MKRWFQILGLIVVLSWCGFATSRTDAAGERSREAEIAVLREQIRQLEMENIRQSVSIQSSVDNILELTRLVASQSAELSLITKLLGISISVTLTQLLAFIFGLIKDKKRNETV